MEIYEKAILTGQTPNTLGFRIWTLLISVSVMGVGIFILYKLHFTDWFDQFRGKPDYAPSELVDLIAVFFLGLGTFGFISSRSTLRLTFHPSNSSIIQKERIINELKSKFDWQTKRSERNYYRFEEPTIYLDNVTIVYDESGYYLSRCGTGLRGGWIDFGKNQRVLQGIIQTIDELENQGFS